MDGRENCLLLPLLDHMTEAYCSQMPMLVVLAEARKGPVVVLLVGERAARLADDLDELLRLLFSWPPQLTAIDNAVSKAA
jgi:hypothetical protein